ncbi:hypothetical protein [Nocardiopsis sp. B62]|uniref:hypothetical protein n=1 Tax=Nocardiopsis sp. B62 TaxID=2824874 RepID=UPI0027DD357E|nr:hypothetical protein [Nocardiopsis sp. B62]
MVPTVTRALPRPALRTGSLITSVVLLVILSFPVASGLSGERDTVALPAHGGHSAPERDAAESADDDPSGASEEAHPYRGTQTVSLGPPVSVCDQRSVLRDLPDVVPTCALRLAVWDQPWWPLPLPHHDPVPETVDAEELPPTRAPPLTAHTLV